jgi:Anti-sigma-K factor rskA
VTTEHATMTCDEFLDAAAAVALHAEAEDIEVRRVEEHAARCPECASRLEEFEAVAVALGEAVPQVEVPGALRGRVLEVAASTPQTRVGTRRRWPRALRRPRLSPAWLVAAASLVLSLGSMVWAINLQGQIAALQRDDLAASERAQRLDHVVQVLASDKLAIRPLQPAVQTMPSRGVVYMDPASGTGMVMCHNLPPIEQGHAYQVWFVRGSERVSGGMLWPDPNGNGYTLIQVPADLQSFESIGLTDEPGSGSAWPTTPRVVGGPLKETSN